MRFFGTLLILIGFSTIVLAQKGSVRGNIYDKETAEPIAAATVKLDGTTYGASSDVNGFFTISSIPTGDYTLVVVYFGYEEYRQPITIKKGEIVFQNINISEAATQLNDVVISGKKEQARTEVQVSKLTVTPKQIRALPSAGGQADVAQYLTVLPGVVFTGDQGGQLYIRGGSPVQNRIMLDGMTIYNPFHSIGFYSVFETELILNVDVLTGGFNADYGGRVSAVVDVKTREGNRKRLAGLVSGSPFLAKAIIEGPLVKMRDENDGSISVLLTGKKGLINQTGKNLYSYVNDSVGIPFDFQDVYGKLSFVAGNGSKINLFGFNYTDGVDFPITDFSWTSTGGGLDFTLVPPNSNTILSGTFTYSRYDSEIEESDRRPRKSGIAGYNGQLNFTNFGRNEEIKYGLELVGFNTDFNFVNSADFAFKQTDYTSEINAYVRYKRKFGALVIEPGFRLQYYASLSNVSPEPRIGLKYNITDRLRFKAAAGVYSQNLFSTVNERDIVNLFVGFLSAPDRLYEPGTTTNTKNKLQKSQHLVGGFEVDVTKNFELNIESYYKKFNQLIGINRFKTELSDPDYFKETGDAYGIDISGKMELKRAYFWLAYSLGYVTRDDGKQIYPPVFDRRHNLNLVSTYQFGKKQAWELGARWNMGSGFPFTLTQGFFTNYDFSNGINTDFLGGNGDIGIEYADKRNGGRLPYYHRLDLSLKRTFKFSKFSTLEVTAACTNVYDRPNIFYFDRVRYDRVNQLPILPTLSASFQF
ncbi:MAG: TonB-dependent receptor [Saprospiraceae bacterium]|nr:TonB-dependent receptor [Saprospiraceae bacterium]